jgi:hypothetical protein
MISLGPTPFTLEVVQNQLLSYVFILQTFWDERAPQGIVDVTPWAFQMMVKRNEDDPDDFAVFDLFENAPPMFPATTGIPIRFFGQFGFTIGPVQNDIAPGNYFGEIRGWDGVAVPGADPPTVKMPFTFRVLQTLDLVYP